MDRERLRRRIARALDARADTATRDWWDRYLKGAIPFRGVKMAGVREVVHEEWPADAGVADALALLEGRYAEDKLTGILALAEILMPQLTLDDVPRLAEAFTHIDDWGTTDWYSVKVLGRFVAHEPERRARSEAIAAWRTAGSLWQRRAAGVAFVHHAKKGDAFFPGFVDLVLDVCAANARDLARFSQTGVGWVLRELAKGNPRPVEAFLAAHADVLTRDAFGMIYRRESPLVRP